MKSGFNKILRNIVAGASDTEFEKVFICYSYILATYEGNVPSRFKRAKRKARNL